MVKRMVVITGPTAAGKTAEALRWAETAAEGAEILSCDSLLVYQGMDIGTAKPSPEERGRAPHHGIDLVPVERPFSVAEYAAYARRVAADIWARGRQVVVAGGSGFYLKSFFVPVVDETGVEPALREEVEGWLQEKGLEALVAQLRELNPGGLGDLDVRNPRRVARALERCLASGLTLGELRARLAAQPDPFPGVARQVILLEREDADLRHRIRERVAGMLRAGLVEEVTALRARGLERNPSAARAIGYRETLAWLDAGGGSREVLGEAIAAHTWALARKQRTWFRHQIPVDERRVLTG